MSESLRVRFPDGSEQNMTVEELREFGSLLGELRVRMVFREQDGTEETVWVRGTRFAKQSVEVNDDGSVSIVESL